MPDAPSWESRLRQGLREEADARSVETEAALQAVLARTAVVRRRRAARVVAVGLVAVAASVVVLVNVRPFPGGRTLPPTTVGTSAPVGAWQRDVVPTGDPATAGVGGRWSMRLRADGIVDLEAPASSGLATDGVSWSAVRDRLRLDAFVNGVCANDSAGTYRWSVGPQGLTLATDSDPCPTRVAVFAGTWAQAGAP
jgi:hypothetical protein